MFSPVLEYVVATQREKSVRVEQSGKLFGRGFVELEGTVPFAGAWRKGMTQEKSRAPAGYVSSVGVWVGAQ